MFEFTWGRLALYLGLLFGVPAIFLGFLYLMAWIESHKEVQPYAGAGCVFIVFAAFLALAVFIKVP